MKITPKLSLWFLLVVLISTFMPPSFAWQMIDSHHETTITTSVLGRAAKNAVNA